jgi:hypothetical protein
LKENVTDKVESLRGSRSWFLHLIEPKSNYKNKNITRLFHKTADN